MWVPRYCLWPKCSRVHQYRAWSVISTITNTHYCYFCPLIHKVPTQRNLTDHNINTMSQHMTKFHAVQPAGIAVLGFQPPGTRNLHNDKINYAKSGGGFHSAVNVATPIEPSKMRGNSKDSQQKAIKHSVVKNPNDEKRHALEQNPSKSKFDPSKGCSRYRDSKGRFITH